MDFLRPAGWAEALAAKAAHPDAVPLTGGTDVMVELTFDRRRPERLLDLSRIPELRTWETGEPFRATLSAEAAAAGQELDEARLDEVCRPERYLERLGPVFDRLSALS